MRRGTLFCLSVLASLALACGGGGGGNDDPGQPQDPGIADPGSDIPVADPGTDGPRPDVPPPQDTPPADEAPGDAPPPQDVPGTDVPGTDLTVDTTAPACTTSQECEDLLTGLTDCQVPICDPGTDTCVAFVLVDNTPCGVPDACQPVKRCKAGECVGAALDCDDGNACTEDSCDPATGCVHAPNVMACDDGNPCTKGDACDNGACVPGPNQCACQGDGDCVAKDDGDKCNGTLVCEGNVCVPDPETVVTCDPHEAAPCMAWVCTPATGTCEETIVNNGGACQDGNACTTDDLCVRGACEGGPVPDCDDRNPCTDDACDPAKGCTHVPNAGSCDDGSACTINDLCVDGACKGGTSLVCDDGNACTGDSCDPAVGCVAVNLDTGCNDANACTVGDRCVGGACVPVANLICNDGNPCTDDSCDKDGGCVFQNAAAECDDGNACTTMDVCQDGQCVGGAATVCEDGRACTADSCDPSKGCVFEPLTGTACTDNDACTEGDACLAGECVFQNALDCDDHNPCTVDGCLKATGCDHKNVADNTTCDDGNGCTTGDKCTAGTCAGVGKVCNDANPCTDDSCNPSTQDCIFTPNTRTCDDGNYCNGKERCSAGACQSLNPPVCDDANVCTTDTCDPVLGCVYTPNTVKCDDGNACTKGDVCAAGVCKGPTPLLCLDTNSCTADTCDPTSGCVFTPLADGTACNDGLFCTVDDACTAGQCTKNNPNTCDDGNVCTTDSCNEDTNLCLHAPNTLSCSDGNTCTHDDSCVMRVCQSGTLIECDQPNPLCHDEVKRPCKCLARYSVAAGCDPSRTDMCWCNPLRANGCLVKAVGDYDAGCYCGLNPPCGTRYECRCKIATDPSTCSCVVPL